MNLRHLSALFPCLHGFNNFFQKPLIILGNQFLLLINPHLARSTSALSAPPPKSISSESIREWGLNLWSLIGKVANDTLYRMSQSIKAERNGNGVNILSGRNGKNIDVTDNGERDKKH